MKLSDRLNIIANEINSNETMADIGCDHGFLPLYLLENNICTKAILCDISKGSLEKAESNFRVYGHDLNCEFRLGNGLDVIDYGEVDNVVIAGMGGILMSEILDNNPEKSKTIKKYILQPRNKHGFLREYLVNNGYIIRDEKLVREGKFICEIIIASPDDGIEKGLNIFPENADSDLKDCYYEFPEYIIDTYSGLRVEYLNRYKNTQLDIIDKTSSSCDIASRKKAQKKLNRIQYLLDKIMVIQ